MRWTGRQGVVMFLMFAGCGPAAQRSPYSTYRDTPIRNSQAAQEACQKGLEYIEHGDDAAAEQAFRESLGYDITNAAAHNNLGLLLLKQKQWYSASWEFAYSTQIQPQSSVPRGNLGLVFEAVGQYDKAINEYEAALKIDADSVQVMGQLARTFVKSGRSPERLKDLLERLVVRADPDWSQWARGQLIRLGSHQ